MKQLYIAILCLAFTAATAQTDWEVLNPKPSYLNAVSMHFVTPNHGYILNEKQLLETVDNGVIWTVKQSVSSGTTMGFNGNTGIIAGYGGYALKTVDSGQTWQYLTTGSPQTFNSVSILDDQHFILSGNMSVLSTADGGLSWQSHSIPSISQIDKTVFVNVSIGWAFTGNGSIYKTIDGGMSWTLQLSINTSPSGFYTAYFLNDSVGFASREFSDILKTTDGGETWTQLQNPGSQAVNAFFFTSETTGYACGEHGAVYKTIDGGNTWELALFQPGYFSGTDMYAIYFHDDNNGFVAGLNGMIEKTTTGGGSWSGHAPFYTNISKLAFTNATTGYVLVGNTFFKTADSGNNWASIGAPSAGENTVDFDFVTPDIGYAIGGSDVNTSGDRRKIFKTTDAGTSWTTLGYVSPIFHDSFYCLDFIDENIGIISGGYNQPSTWRTADAGASWQQVNAFSFGKIQFVTPLVGYARRVGGSLDKIYKTTNAGISWNEVFSTDYDMNDFDFVDQYVGFFAGDNGAMFKTTDGGTIWNAVSMPYGHFERIKMLTPNVIYTQDTYLGKIFKSADQGATWEMILNFYNAKSMVFHDSKIYLAGIVGRIIRSGLETLDLQHFGRSDGGIVVYPNPAFSRVNIETDGMNGIRTIAVYDLAGRLLSTQSENGQTKAQLYFQGKSNGLYLIEVTTDKGVFTRKLQIE